MANKNAPKPKTHDEMMQVIQQRGKMAVKDEKDALKKGEELEFCGSCQVAISPMTKERGMRCVYCANR